MRVRIFGHQFPLAIVLVALIEALLFLGCFHAAVHLRFASDFDYVLQRYSSLWPRSILFALVTFLSYAALGLYAARQRAGKFGLGMRMVTAHACGIAVVAGLYYFLPEFAIGRGVTLLAAGMSVVMSGLLRAISARLFDLNAMKTRVLIYGWGKGIEPFRQLRRRTDRRGFQIVGFICPEGEELHLDGRVIDLNQTDLVHVCLENDVAEIVVAMEDRRVHFPQGQLLACRTAGVHVVDVVTFLERETGRVYLSLLNPSWMIFGEGFRKDAIRQFCVRVFDVVTAAALLGLSLPLMIVTALAIWIDEGPRAKIIYKQQRVGLGGALFDLYKFRSMRMDAEKSGQAQWAAQRDPRVTRVGSIIRRCRVDELPQLLNVLRGEMSFVGPRPERPQFVSRLARSVPFYEERHSVKPGITGWAQLCYPYGASELDAWRKLEYDLYYVKNKSLLFDVSILVQTAEVIVVGRGVR